MAISDIQTNNKLIKFTQQINREWVRENMFSPYMGEDHQLHHPQEDGAEGRRRGDEHPAGVAGCRAPVSAPDRWSATKRRSTTTACGFGWSGSATRWHHQGRAAEGQRRHLRRGQTFAVGLAVRGDPRRDHRGAHGVADRKVSRRRAPASTAFSMSLPPRRNATHGAPTTPTASCTVHRRPTRRPITPHRWPTWTPPPTRRRRRTCRCSSALQ